MCAISEKQMDRSAIVTDMYIPNKVYNRKLITVHAGFMYISANLNLSRASFQLIHGTQRRASFPIEARSGKT